MAPPPTLKAVAAVIWSSCITAVGYGRAFCVLAFYIYLRFHVLSMKYLLLADMTLLNMLQNTMLLNMPPDNHSSRLVNNLPSSSSPRTPLSSTLSPFPPLHHIGLRIPPASALPRRAPQNPPKHRDSRGSKTQLSQVESSQGTLLSGPQHHEHPVKTSFGEKKSEKVVVEVEEEQFVETSRNSLAPVSQFHLPAVIPVVIVVVEKTLRISKHDNFPRTSPAPLPPRGDKRRLGTQRSAPRI
jgi:hypothetical protein